MHFFLCRIEDLYGVSDTGKTFFSLCLLGISVTLRICKVSKQLSSRPLSCKDFIYLIMERMAQMEQLFFFFFQFCFVEIQQATGRLRKVKRNPNLLPHTKGKKSFLLK